MEEVKKVKKKKSKIKHKIIVPVVSAVALLTVIMIIAFMSMRLLGDIRYSNVTEGFNNFIAGFSDGEGYPFKINYNDVKAIDMLGSRPVVVESNSVYVLNAAAAKTVEAEHTYLNPAVRVNNGRILLFDRASGKYMVLSGTKLLYEKALDVNIITAAIGSNGSVAVATESSSARSRLTVFSPRQDEIFVWDCASGYISDIDFASGNRVAVTIIGIDTADVTSKVVFLDFDMDKAVASFDFPASAALESEYISGNRLAVVGNDFFSVIEKDMTAKSDNSFSPYNISNISRNGNIYALALSGLDAGKHILKVYNKKGVQLFETEIDNKTDDISVCGSHVAVLLDGTVKIFNKLGELTDTLDVGNNVYRIRYTGSVVYAFSVNSITKHEVK